jgi:hypothetical protein
MLDGCSIAMSYVEMARSDTTEARQKPDSKPRIGSSDLLSGQAAGGKRAE